MKKVCAFLFTLLFVLASALPAAAEEKLTFTTTDLSGNTVTEKLLKGYDLVLFNLWEPWCGYCVDEMPELEELYRAYKGKGILVVGVVNRSPYEGYVPEETVRETGVTYPIINYCSAFDRLCPEYSFPASFVVDGNGRTVSVKKIMAYALLSIAGEDADDYKAGGYDAYLNDPAYSNYQPLFDLLKAAADGGDAELMDLAEYYAKDRFRGTEAFYGSLSGQAWKKLFAALRAR